MLCVLLSKFLVGHITNHFFGIKENGDDLLHLYDGDIQVQILLDLNVDGVPLFKSMGGQWPTLDCVSEVLNQPLVIHMLLPCKHKPQSLDCLEDLV